MLLLDISEICLGTAKSSLGGRHRVDAPIEVRGLEGFDVVMAAYLFNYAQDRAQLRRMAESAFRSLKPGGRLCGVNDNPRIAPETYREVFEQVGFTEFRFVDAHVAPGADPAPFRDFLQDCPICGICAVRPADG